MYRSLLLADQPEALFSLFDVQLNAMCTAMARMADWNSFAGHWKGLRVSKSHGEQCSTYFLSLFYRFAVPLILTSICLQWLLSQTFSMRITYAMGYDKEGGGGGYLKVLISDSSLKVFCTVLLLAVCAVLLLGYWKIVPNLLLVMDTVRSLRNLLRSL